MKFKLAAAAILNLLLCLFWSNGLFPVAAPTLLQNFIHLRQSAAELLLFVQKSKVTASWMLFLCNILAFMHVGPQT